MMKRIIEEKECKLIEQRSKFISYVFSCDDLVSQSIILKRIKRLHPSATHICYASVIDEQKTFNDDREPSGTAGAQMALVLNKENMVNTLCVVVRYFGGVKLGVPGLSKAYKEASELCLENNTKEVVLKDEYLCECSYSLFDVVKSTCGKLNIPVYDEIFGANVSFKICLSHSEFLIVSKLDFEMTITGKKVYV